MKSKLDLYSTIHPWNPNCFPLGPGLISGFSWLTCFRRTLVVTIWFTSSWKERRFLFRGQRTEMRGQCWCGWGSMLWGPHCVLPHWWAGSAAGPRWPPQPGDGPPLAVPHCCSL
jgi:hypothetical protein